jgi:hypothetical protein
MLIASDSMKQHKAQHHADLAGTTNSIRIHYDYNRIVPPCRWHLCVARKGAKNNRAATDVDELC